MPLGFGFTVSNFSAKSVESYIKVLVLPICGCRSLVRHIFGLMALTIERIEHIFVE